MRAGGDAVLAGAATARQNATSQRLQTCKARTYKPDPDSCRSQPQHKESKPRPQVVTQVLP